MRANLWPTILRWRPGINAVVCVSLALSSSPLAARLAAPPPSFAAPAVAAALPAALAVAARPPAVAPAAEQAALEPGVVMGMVANAQTGDALAGVQVVASGVPDELPKYRVSLPVIVNSYPRATSPAVSPGPSSAASPALASTVTLTTTTGADGSFSLETPPAEW
jgi:hypothetical protein